jgi:hypothetical protein
VYPVPAAVPPTGSLPDKEIEIRAANQHRSVLVLPSGGTTLSLGATHLILDGLFIVGGKLAVAGAPGKRAQLTLRRCTFVAPGGVAPDSAHLTDLLVPPSPDGQAIDLTVDHCVVGAIRRDGGTGNWPGMVTVRDSIVSGNLAADTLLIERSTVFGDARADTVELASDTIFLGALTVKFAQRGCVRYSYVPAGSTTPPRFRCQPDLATSASGLTSDQAQAIRDRVAPSFVSRRFGDPGFGQLSLACDEQILRGASDGGELGAFQSLHGTQRRDNLSASLDEYLRFGNEAGIFYLT